MGDTAAVWGLAWPGERGRRLLVAAVSGLALHLAYPRPGWDLLGWVSLAPLLALAWTAESVPQATREGWVAGLAFFGPLLRWITHTMTVFAAMAWPLAWLIVLLLAAYLAVFWAVVSSALAWLRPRLGGWTLWLAAPLWVTAELARTYLLSGFPWGLLGYVPYRRLALIQIAAWTGVYGVSCLLVVVNAAVAWVLVRRTWRALGTAALVALLALGVTVAVGRARLATTAAPVRLPVGIVQGNIDQAIKWNRAFREHTLHTYGALTREVAPGQRLVVWPEAAIPAYLRHEAGVLTWLVALAGEAGAPLLVGAPDAEVDARGTRYLNSAFLVRERGLVQRYDKMHLVPFGEYVPLRRLLFFVEALAVGIGEFAPGAKPVIFPLDGAPFGTVICYEVIFPRLFREFVARGATFMTNITNDAWFGDSGGPLQHLAMVPLRAVENGVAVVRAANTGVSALVAPSGAIGPILALGTRGVLRAEVPLRARHTFYTRAGDLFAYACAAAAAMALGAAWLAGREA